MQFQSHILEYSRLYTFSFYSSNNLFSALTA